MLALDEVARRLGKEKHAHDEDDGPGELHRNRNPIGARVLPEVGGVIQDGSKKEADRDCELVSSYDGPANPLGCGFGLVEGNWGAER